jgi:Asp-tRNA(Asn)/Glu-tRNA(Gln) amidotransferase A subunit family amidase
MGILRQAIQSPEALVERCRERIAALEGGIHAWSALVPAAAAGPGPLRGVPYGAKDIYETAGLPTEYGSAIYKGRKGDRDAALVELLRGRGAVLIGKTHTTAFAYYDAGPTRNPRNLAHTPGGSSSGSAAAVAAGMAPFALGSQTQGSVLRPASFCGVCGFKPTFGLLPTAGVLPFAPTLDTAGLFTEDAADMRLLWDRMGYEMVEAGRFTFGMIHPFPEVDPAMRAAVQAAASKLGARPAELPPSFAGLLGSVRIVNTYEGARTHAERWRKYGDRVGVKLAALVQEGLETSEARYRAALESITANKQKISAVFETFEVLLAPAAPGPAPLGLAWTGDPRLNSPWTALGTPAITIPLPVAPGALPLGLQLVAAPGDDRRLLARAEAAEAALAGK